MSGIQYTIRGISQEVDRRLREDARKTGKSLNGLVVETLERATLPGGPPYHSLDWFFGMSEGSDAGEDEALQWLDALPRDLPE